MISLLIVSLHKTTVLWTHYEDTVIGAQAEREGLASLINSLRPGDTVVIWCLDRLGRSGCWRNWISFGE